MPFVRKKILLLFSLKFFFLYWAYAQNKPLLHSKAEYEQPLFHPNSLSEFQGWARYDGINFEGYRSYSHMSQDSRMLQAPNKKPRVSNCCICIYNVWEKNQGCDASLNKLTTANSCTAWYKFALNLAPTKAHPVFESKVSCDKIFMWGYFHGLASESDLPFNLSRFFSSALDAKEVCYNGNTCEIFASDQKTYAAAINASRLDPHTKYMISGNQLTGYGELRGLPVLNLQTIRTFYLNYDPSLFSDPSHFAFLDESKKVANSFGNCLPANTICRPSSDRLVHDTGFFCSTPEGVTRQYCCKHPIFNVWSTKKIGETCR